ncbi:MAG: MAPEG family protein [Acinetobacter sp.]|nr:MAPEG family protein [Acinetobacter sp.]
MKVIIATLIINLLFPLIFAALARILGGFRWQHHAHPRQFLANTTGMAARANAVQQNSFENLLFFIPAVVFAIYMMIPIYVVQMLCIAHLIFRLLFAVSYVLNWSILRSIMWFLAAACNGYLLFLAYYYG